jgi:hypothetical protein
LIRELTPHKRERAAILNNSREYRNSLAVEEVAKMREDIMLGSKAITMDIRGK